MLRIIVIGRCKDRRLAALADDYVARIRPLAPVEVIELKDADPKREATAMVQRLGARDPARPVLALDEHGEDLTTVQLSALLGAHGGLSFLVGGADGATERLLASERKRFLSEEWPLVAARIEQLGIDPDTLIKPIKGRKKP